jgi:hypothetical protein
MKFNDGTNIDKYLSNINKYLPFSEIFVERKKFDKKRKFRLPD